MRAIFIEKNGSMGLTHEEEYEIKVVPCGIGFAVLIPNRHWACPYDTFNGMLKNWHLIQEDEYENG